MRYKPTPMCALIVLAGGLLGYAALANHPSRSEREAVVRVVTKWDGGCSGSRRSKWDNMVRAWYNDITDDRSVPSGHDYKAWVRDGFYKNGNIVDSDFVDCGIAWGNDCANDRVDEVDVCMVAMHGAEYTDAVPRWYGKVRVNEAGTGNCNAYQGHMFLGDSNDLEFLHLSSCHSMCEDNWNLWRESFAGVHQIDGFHGIMYIGGGGWIDDYEDFADDAFDISIADAWLDNLYDPEHWYEWWQDGDQCPVARAAGTSESDAVDRIGNEQYDNVTLYPDVDDPPWFARMYIGDCDPWKDPPLP